MQIDEKDLLFWQETIKDVPIFSQVSFQPKKKKSPIKIRIRHKSHLTSMQKHLFYSKALEDEEFSSIDKATLRRFKREEFPVEAVLDLHGLNEDQAFNKVDKFIPQCYSQGKRCVIIITGKGLSNHNPDNIFATKGLLKKQVPQWLNMSRLHSLILIYKHPSERLGGSGALYILLRRNKNLI